ncbi:MAG TPA: DinB family protein [Gemmatimonadales bacterium]|nr:DinB family protein [Gemmatimonadales bacterium]
MTPARRAAAAPSLSPVELLFSDFANEHALTRRMLERFPDSDPAWRPHPKSRTVAELATHVAAIINRGWVILETDTIEARERSRLAPIESAARLVEFFDASVARFTAALAATDFDALKRPWELSLAGRVVATYPKRVALRVVMMSHLIHHRGQLGVYYRLLGIPIPALYGPSADESVL